MGKVILKNAIKRRKGYLYYVDGKGNSIWEPSNRTRDVCEAMMARGKRKRR